MVSVEDFSPSPAILAVRDKLGFDYAKLDYVMIEGEVVLLDVNRTPGMNADREELERQGAILAPGLTSLLEKAGHSG